jgi:hypothetical protein
MLGRCGLNRAVVFDALVLGRSIRTTATMEVEIRFRAFIILLLIEAIKMI